MTDYSDIVKRLRVGTTEKFRDGSSETVSTALERESADAIEILERELKCANELWEQQKELALEYLADIEKANERIAELEASIDKNDEWTKWFIEKTDARIAELEAALKPFADKATACEQRYSDFVPEDDRTFAVTLGDLRQARKTLGEKDD